MPWFRVDDGFHCHPKVLAARNAAVGLWVRCGSYCAQQSTDGFVPAVIAKAYGTRTEIARLIDVGAWTEAAGGYQMHDYLEYNYSSDKVKADRDAAAERKRKSRRDSHSDNGDGHTVTEGVGHGVSHTTQAKPSQAIGITSHYAAAAVLLPPAAAAALDLFVAHRLATEPDIRNTDRYAAKIRRDETALHGPELIARAAEDSNADAESMAMHILGLTRSQLITASVHLERSRQ